MLAKILALLTALALHPNRPDDKPRPQHFCCASVDPESGIGEACTAIGPEQIDECAAVLSCPDAWAKHDGKVHCR